MFCGNIHKFILSSRPLPDKCPRVIARPPETTNALSHKPTPTTAADPHECGSTLMSKSPGHLYREQFLAGQALSIPARPQKSGVRHERGEDFILVGMVRPGWDTGQTNRPARRREFFFVRREVNWPCKITPEPCQQHGWKCSLRSAHHLMLGCAVAAGSSKPTGPGLERSEPRLAAPAPEAGRGVAAQRKPLCGAPATPDDSRTHPNQPPQQPSETPAAETLEPHTLSTGCKSPWPKTPTCAIISASCNSRCPPDSTPGPKSSPTGE